MPPSLSRAFLSRHAPPFVKKLGRGTQRQWSRLRAAPPPRHLFVFGGRNHHWPGMGRELYAREPAFRETVQACEQITTQTLDGPSLLPHFEGEPDPDFLKDEQRVIHILIVVQLATVSLWRAYGVQPDAVMGLSLGNAAALHTAGNLTLTDAMRVSAFIRQVSQQVPPDHLALMVEAGFEAAAALAAGCPVEWSIVTVIDADRCLVFCAVPDVPAATAYLQARGVRCHRLNNIPFWPYHTTRLARHQTALREPLRPLLPRPLTLPCYLGPFGRVVAPGTVLGIDFWLQAVQSPVQLHATLGAVLADGYRVLTPIGSDPFPFYTGPTRQARFGTARLLTPMQPGVSETDTFDANRQELARLRLVRPRPVIPAEPDVTAHVAKLRLLAPDFVANPHPGFAFLRRHGGVHFIPSEPGWLVLEAELINQVLRQPALFSSKVNAEYDAQLMGADPPLHTANRAIFQPFFTPKAQGALAGFAAVTIREMAETLRGRAAFDFVKDFAVPVTQAVAAELMGLARAEREALQKCLTGHPYSLPDYTAQVMGFITDHFQRRPTPGGEPLMLDILLDHHRRGELTFEAVYNLTKTMWLAGTVTTSMLMTTATHYLLTHPVVAGQLRAEPELVDAFVEEMLRLEPPLNAFWRVTTQPVTLGGREIPANHAVICCVAAANRDPARYPDPDELDLRRRPTVHLAFSGGIHACMGAPLARIEGRLMVKWMLEQGAALRLANPFARLDYYLTNHFRAHASLPMVLRPVAPA